MINNKRFPLNFLSSSLLIALGTSSALSIAQEDKTTGQKLEVIEVTAQKRTQSINDVPLSITAFNGKMLQEKGIENTTDLAASVPGFSFSDSHSGTPIYTMRGVGFNETSAQASSTVGVYINEVGTPFPIMTKGPMLDVERVEVLKGPQGTLYGRNSTGGAINYITAKPTDDYEAGVKTSYGSYQTANLEGFISGGLSDNLQGRIAVKSLSSGEGWQKSVSQDAELGKKDKLALRLSLAAQFGNKTTADFSYDYWKDQSDTLAPRFVHAQYGKDPGPVRDMIAALFTPYLPVLDSNDATQAEWSFGETPSVDMNNRSASLTINSELSDDISFISLTNYAKFNDNGSQYDRGGMIGVLASTVPDGFKSGYLENDDSEYLQTDASITRSTIDSFTQEFRLNGTTDISTWVAGIYYSDNHVVGQQTQILELNTNTNLHPVLKFLNFPTLDNKADQKSTTTAVFASADWQLDDKWVITTGIRYTQDKSNYEGCTADSGDGALADVGNIGLPAAGLLAAPTDTSPGECLSIDATGKSGLAVDELNENSLSWRLAANYSVSDDTSIYASYSRGFKAGSFPTLGAFTHEQLLPVVQEEVDAFELGIKATAAEGTAQINAAAFYYDYTNKQMLTKVPDPIFGKLWALRNIPESKVSGAEIDVTWLLTEQFTLTAAANYTNTEITEFVGNNQLSQVLDFSGSRFPLTSEVQASITGEYEWKSTESTYARIAFDASYTGEANTDYEGVDSNGVAQYDNRFINDSYTLINARIGIYDEADTWAVYLWARNLTDEFYTNNVIMNSDNIGAYVGMPRTVGINFNYNWF